MKTNRGSVLNNGLNRFNQLYQNENVENNKVSYQLFEEIKRQFPKSKNKSAPVLRTIDNARGIYILKGNNKAGNMILYKILKNMNLNATWFHSDETIHRCPSAHIYIISKLKFNIDVDIIRIVKTELKAKDRVMSTNIKYLNHVNIGTPYEDVRPITLNYNSNGNIAQNNPFRNRHSRIKLYDLSEDGILTVTNYS